MIETNLEDIFPDPVVRRAVERVNNNNRTADWGMSTTYSLLNEEKKLVQERKHSACFGDLPTMYTSSCCYLRYNFCVASPVTEACQRWLELCKEVGIFDDSTPVDKKEGLLVNLQDPETRVGKLYLQLCVLRWLQEATSLVLNVIDLVDNAGRDFWSAVAYCHNFNVANVDHSVLPFSNNIYTSGGWPQTASRNFALVLRLHEAVVNPAAVDSRPAKKALEKKYQFDWGWHRKALKVPKDFVLKNRAMLLSDELFPILGAYSWDEAAQRVNQLQKRKSSVEFENSNSN